MYNSIRQIKLELELIKQDWVWLRVFNAPFITSLRSVLLVEEIRVPREKYEPVKLYRIKLYRVHILNGGN